MLEPTDRHHALLLNLAQALGRLGDTEAAGELLREAAAACSPAANNERANILFYLADWLMSRVALDEPLRIYQAEFIPILDELGDERSRAATLGKIAGVLSVRGELDEALRICREETLPVYDRLGDALERALTLGRIANALEARGAGRGAAHRPRRNNCLPTSGWALCTI